MARRSAADERWVNVRVALRWGWELSMLRVSMARRSAADERWVNVRVALRWG
ncbi:hypothetical protein [Vibrio sp. SCSIO 43169]|uniref:hypothetical protein n=1 Tax=Vibrio sp. SCSIO 43169 TaxID=2822801 RepID=UPI0020436E56|nr:hypothetical protein [Vibrio sp. SCSIO 43169]MCM5510974.1 hypothetical protein [Vibrio sp. SCSIO 43169]